MTWMSRAGLVGKVLQFLKNYIHAMYTIYQNKPSFLHGFKNEDDDDVE